jgi:glyoxylase-like metal-dependent hydrolase (beta-lactamase superfamily II)
VPAGAGARVRLLWEDNHVVNAALRLEAAPGHTPGSSVLKLASGSQHALFAGDLLHTPLQVAEVDHNSCFCEDPAGARAARRAVLGWASDHAALVLPAHFSGHGAMEVECRGDSFGIRRWAGFDRL